MKPVFLKSFLAGIKKSPAPVSILNLFILSFLALSIKFWSLWDDEKLIGCGALKFLDKEHGEFKSIRIHNNFRMQGQGINVINHLINEAKRLKIKRLSIETGAGDFFMPARKLFKKTGFTVCEPFAHYKEDINSVYLTKLIDDR